MMTRPLARYCILAAFLMGAAEIRAQDADPFGAGLTPAATDDLLPGYVRGALKQVEVPAARFENTPLEKVLAGYRKAIEKAGKDIELVLYETAAATRVTLDLPGLDLDTALQVITQATGCEWTIDEGKAVVFSNAILRAAHARRNAHPIRTVLREVTLPELDFKNTPLSEAITKAVDAATASEKKAGREFPFEAILAFKKTVEEDPLVTVHFDGQNLDITLEVLTRIHDGFEWTVDGGHDIVVFTPDFGDPDLFGDAGGADGFAADPFSAGDASAALPALTGRSSMLAPKMEGSLLPPDRAATRRPQAALPPEAFAGEDYAWFRDNPFYTPDNAPLSTFSIDVDTAAYANARRFIESGNRPPADAVRIEELVNYFKYGDAPPAAGENEFAPHVKAEHPLAMHLELSEAPWTKGHQLLRVALKGAEVDPGERPDLNLVYLIDVSGSMGSAKKLPLVKTSLKLLLGQLRDTDRVGIVVYAGETGVALESTPISQAEAIGKAVDGLGAGGSTNGAGGLVAAYAMAEKWRRDGDASRVILCTDGDFNVGKTGKGDLVGMIAEKAKTGIGLTVLGFGMGNYQDSRLEAISGRGDGNYAYIDGEKEARKIFVEQALGTVLTIAKDVKIQIEFNPATVAFYRLIGYENRLLEAEDFNDDEIDAGELGAGHRVTALYEIVPRKADAKVAEQIGLKYQKLDLPGAEGELAKELLTAKLRYKWPGQDTSQLIEQSLPVGSKPFAEASSDLRFAAAVASWGMLLRGSPYSGDFDFADVIRLADANRGADPHKREFVDLVKKSRKLPKLEIKPKPRAAHQRDPP